MTDAPPPPGAADPANHAPFKLRLEEYKGTPEEIERQWYEQVYLGRGDTMLQLTWRSVIMGAALGSVLSLTNLYIGLKSGWGFGVAITACILSYSIWTALYQLKIVGSKMTILENNCMQSVATASGYTTGGTLVSAIAAYIMVTHTSIPLGTLLLWIFFLAILGVTMAVPMKRQMINVAQLRFPSGVAAAETLQALHTTGGNAVKSARALGVAGVLAGWFRFMVDGTTLLANKFKVPFAGELTLPGSWAPFDRVWSQGSSYTVMMSWEPLFIAAGAITGLRVCASMMIGGTLCWAVFLPWLHDHLAAQDPPILIELNYKELVSWSLWGGASCMVTAGLLSFAMQWRSALRALSAIGGLFTNRQASADDPLAAIEAPSWWFVTGQVSATIGLAILGEYAFNMPWWLTVLAVGLSFGLALVACRVCGETDTSPVGAMGKIMQLTFGAIRPGAIVPNLMGACITAGAADSSSGLLIDLKSGYLLGANPRKQFLAQFAGVFVGTFVSVLTFVALVPNAEAIGNDQFPAPAARTWAAVAEALGKGLGDLHPIKVWLIIIGGAVGIILPILERLVPEKVKPFVPSASGIGLSWTFHWYYAALFFLGGVLGWIFEKARPSLASLYLYPVASGVIAGESLMGVAIVMVEHSDEIYHRFVGPA